MNISVGDKIFAKESTWIADKGKIGNVTAVNGNLVSFTFEGNSKVDCTMDFATFNHYFAKVEEEKAEAPRITEEYIDAIMAESEFRIWTEFDKCTIASCQLPNGFVITESSACVSPENYNAEIGEKICMKKIKDKIWELEAYLLQEALYVDALHEESLEECPYGCEDCEDCPCDGSGCE